jgi:hypothetical protein
MTSIISLSILLLLISGALSKRLRISPNDSRKLVATSGEGAISQQYILRFKDDVIISDVEQRANELATLMGASISWLYQSVFKGFAFSLHDVDTDPAGILAEEVDVEVVEQVTSSSVILMDTCPFPLLQ